MSERDGFEQRPYTRPPGATEVLLVRHGASATAVPGAAFPLTDGRGDPPLGPDGLRQAEAIAAHLADEEFAGLYVTTLRRTHQTAAPLAAARGLTPTPVAELAEVRLGDWEGEYRVRVGLGDPLIAEMHAQERWDVIPNAESFASLGARVRHGIDRIVAETGPDAGAVAILHGAVIGELCRQATASRPFAFIHADNGSISRLMVLGDGRWLLRSFNDITHLR